MVSIFLRRRDFWGMSKMTSQVFEAIEEFLDVCFRWRTHESLSFAYCGNIPLTWIFHELPASTVDMTVLPGVLGPSFGRLRTSSPCDALSKYARIQSPALPGGTAISTFSGHQFMKYPG
jgi:hypothetical protein